MTSGQRFGGYESLELLATARQPPQPALARVARNGGLALPRNDVIELHDHVGTEISLDAHHPLGREAPARPIEVTAKLHPILVHRPQRGEGAKLKGSRVGENRAVPLHSRVEAAKGPDQLVARAEMQVIRIA